MKRLISTLNLSKEDWLRYRKCGITGTDAGAILGLNPYRSAFQVYHDKISETIENIDNEAMRQGRDLEDYVAQRFTEATGLKVRRANAIYQSEEHPLLLADFDRLIVGQRRTGVQDGLAFLCGQVGGWQNPRTLHGSGQSLSGCQRF